MQYIRFSEGYNKNKLIPVSESPYKHIKNMSQPHFISMMKYSKEQFQKWQETKSVAGMGDGLTDRIWVDFDSKANLKLAFQDAKVFVERLYALGFMPEEIQISFSGNKGIGIIVDTEQTFTIEQVQTLCTKLAAGLKTFDTSMYDHQRIFRLLFTKNEKTGLFKTPIQFEDLDADPETIKESAKSIDDIDQDAFKTYYKRSTVQVPEKLLTPEKKPVEVKTVKLVDSTEKPRHWKEYKWQLLQGNFEPGERHNALMVVAATCRGLGYDSQTALAMCQASDAKHCAMHKRTDPSEDLEDNIIESVYAPNWKGGQYSPDTNPWLKSYCERLGIDTSTAEQEFNVIKIGDVRTDFIDYMRNIEANTVKTGINVLDEAMPLTTGMICGVVGAPSSGKTAIALKMLENTSKNGVLSVFASLDMHRTRLFQKLVMGHTNMNRKELIESVQNGGSEDVFAKIQKAYENVYFYDRSAASVPEIRKYIERVQETTGQKVKFLMVDYFERLGSERSDDTAASKEVAGALQDLCNDLNLCIVVLVQPNKFSLGGGPDSPIKSYTAIKGSSFLYQAFRSIISIWRPFFTPELKEHDRFMQMAILKNDLGELDLFNFSWNGRKGEIEELTEEGQNDLKRLLKQKEQDKAEDKANDGWG